MKLAYVQSDKTGQVNLLLAKAAQTLIDNGVRVVGTTQIDTPNPNATKCDMDVRVLPDGDVFRISQNLGQNARGCRLDTDALERAVAQTIPRLQDAELLIINKFGKHEAEGRGFRELIGEALSRDIPVLVGTNALNIDAFQEFCDGQATCLTAEPDVVLTWLRSTDVAAA
ncbi:DUF2478 domain-containing protein [Shimia sp.]|uniref:DUF2478 domain-containing protein n=1 Tax=Shimia sp. TaxID=1954381 RepID=UPI0032986CF1